MYALGVNGDINDKEMQVLTNLQTLYHKTDSVILSQHCMQLFMMLLLELINVKSCLKTTSVSF